MNCKKYRKLFDAYRKKSLPPGDKRELESHLSSCSSCREDLATGEWLDTSAALLGKQDPPEDYFDSFENKLVSRIQDEGIRAAFERKTGFFLLRPSFRFIASAAVVVFVSVVVVTIGLRSGSIDLAVFKSAGKRQQIEQKNLIQPLRDDAVPPSEGKSAPKPEDADDREEFARERSMEPKLKSSGMITGKSDEMNGMKTASKKQRGKGAPLMPPKKIEQSQAQVSGSSNLEDLDSGQYEEILEGLTTSDERRKLREMELSAAHSRRDKSSMLAQGLLQNQPGNGKFMQQQEQFKGKFIEIEMLLQRFIQTPTDRKTFVETQTNIKKTLPVPLTSPVQSPGTGITFQMDQSEPVKQLNANLERISTLHFAGEKSGDKQQRLILQKYVGNALFNLATIYAQDFGDISRALTLYELVVKAYPGNTNAPESQYQIGELWYHDGQWMQAIQAYQKLCEEYPKDHRCTAAREKVNKAREYAK